MEQYIAEYARMIVEKDPGVLGLDVDTLKTVVADELAAFEPSRTEIGLVAIAIDEMARKDAPVVPRSRRNKDPMFR